MRFEISRTFGFEAAHKLPHAPAGHKCRRLHGHSYEVTVALEGPLDGDTGWLRDLGDITLAWAQLQDELDHRYLNEVPGLENPTSEVLAEWIWQRLAPGLPELARVEVAETCTSRCIYRGD